MALLALARSSHSTPILLAFCAQARDVAARRSTGESTPNPRQYGYGHAPTMSAFSKSASVPHVLKGML